MKGIRVVGQVCATPHSCLRRNAREQGSKPPGGKREEATGLWTTMGVSVFINFLYQLLLLTKNKCSVVATMQGMCGKRTFFYKIQNVQTEHPRKDLYTIFYFSTRLLLFYVHQPMTSCSHKVYGSTIPINPFQHFKFMTFNIQAKIIQSTYTPSCKHTSQRHAY